MKRALLALALLLVVLSGCGEDPAESQRVVIPDSTDSAAAVPQETVTVTETVTVAPLPESLPDLLPERAPDLLPDTGAESSTGSTDDYRLTVAADGCGVIRTGELGDDLTWVVTDGEGFQVLARNAAGETRYRYFVGGDYDVVLQAWNGEYYADVSNSVAISC